MVESSPVNFASDNAAPVAPEIMEALARANTGPAMGYGNDPLTLQVENQLKDLFECDLRAFPVATGTAANVLGLSVMVPPYGSVYCHKCGHIENDECGAPEFFTGGAKLVLMLGEMGKLSAVALDDTIANAGMGSVHHVQPAVISLTQATECGTIYSAEEINAISEVAKKYSLGLHMDGARFANAVATLECAPADITWRAGVDVLSFGATKNGAMAVEAVVFFDMDKAREFEFRRKRGAHLFSKLRYLSAQLNGYLENQLWLKMATHANEMAKKLSEGISGLEGADLVYPVEANMIFACLPQPSLDRLGQSNILYYPSGPVANREVRLVTSWNTTDADIDTFLEVVR